MFRGLSEFISEALERLRDTVSSFFGGQAEDGDPQPTVAPEQIQDSDPSSEQIEAGLDEDFEYDDEPEEIESSSDFQNYLAELEAYEDIVDAREFATPLADYTGDIDDLRVIRYTSAEEAYRFLEEAGIDAFSEIIEFDDDEFGIAVHDSPGAGE